MPVQNSIRFLHLSTRTPNDCTLLCILSVSCCVVSFCICHFLTFVFTGYYLEVEVRHAPNRWYAPCQLLLWLLGVDPSELSEL